MADQQWQAAAEVAPPPQVELAKAPKDETTIVFFNMGTKTYLNHAEGGNEQNNDNPVQSWNAYVDGGAHCIKSHKVSNRQSRCTENKHSPAV